MMMSDANGMHRRFWLSRVQVINWGVFDGYHDVHLSEKGTLLTGASGAGKSSILDAVSVGFLSSRRRNFNASGDRSAGPGSSGSQRSVDKYIRGLVGDIQDSGENTKQKFLRDKGPAWSAIALTYSSSDGSVITGMVLKWLAAGHETNASSLFAITGKDVDIKSQCDEWATNGYAKTILEKVGWQCRREESWYLDTLYGSIGLDGADAALNLLGKAKSLKSVGDLETFVRDYMLDEPASITELSSSLEQIEPLIQARAALTVARKKQDRLKDIDETHQTYLTESQTLSKIGLLDERTVESWVDHQRLERIPVEVDRLGGEIVRINEEISSIEDRQKMIESRKREVLNIISRIDGNLAPLKAQLEDANVRVNTVTAARSQYNKALLDLNLGPVETAEAFLSLRGECAAQENSAAASIKSLRGDPLIAAHTALSQSREQWKAATEELKRVEGGSSVPENEESMRRMVVQALGLTISDLPYVCELMDLRRERSLWRRAVEKVLYGTGRILLVPERHHRAVLRYVNEHNMGGLLRMEKVTVGITVVEPPRNTLASCLDLTDRGHECAGAAARLITTRGDYIMVDSTDDFTHHRRAVTVEGLRKDSDFSSVKDDRKELRASQYIFQGNIIEKIAALRVEVTEAEEKSRLAEASLEKIEAEIKEHVDRQEQCRSLNKFELFNMVDVVSATVDAERLQRQLDAVMAENPDYAALEKEVDGYTDVFRELVRQSGRFKDEADSCTTVRTQLLTLQQSLDPAPIDDDQRAAIEPYLSDMSHTLELLDVSVYVKNLWNAISRDQDRRSDIIRKSRKDLETIIGNFDEDFPDSIPNNSSDLDEKVNDYVVLWRRLKDRDVKAAEENMQRLITEQAPHAILRLYHLADEEARRIDEQISQVNSGLASVEYGPGTILKLCADNRKLTAAQHLKDFVRRITERIPAVSNRDPKATYEQFQDILDLRNMLASDQAEHRRWREEALDVRKWFTFYCAEHRKDDLLNAKIYRNAHSKSGGEQEKLMAFCLAGALSYNLADHDSGDTRPVFSQLMIDEAFSKSDPNFARQSLAAFRRFGFQLLIVATVQNTTVIQPFIEKVVMVSKNDEDLAATQTVTVQRLTELRKDAAAAAAAGLLAS